MLEFIKNELAFIGVPYEFMRWTDIASYPYFVGEYTGVPTDTEDGNRDSTFILTGFTRNSWLELEQIREKVERHFSASGGLRGQTSDGGAVAVFYSSAFPVPTGEADLKKIQINLDVKEWRANE